MPFNVSGKDNVPDLEELIALDNQGPPICSARCVGKPSDQCALGLEADRTKALINATASGNTLSDADEYMLDIVAIMTANAASFDDLMAQCASKFPR